MDRLSGRHVKGLDEQSELMWEDGERSFWRVWSCTAIDAGTECIGVTAATGRHSTATDDRFAHEYAVREQLDDEWALMPLELVRETGETILILRSQRGECLTRLLETPPAASGCIRIAIALTGAVCGLHDAGLLHKDIKPANFLVDVDSGRAWLTGFGIATRLPRQRAATLPPECLAGSLAYMAPEQTGRMNRSIDSRSDLYSLGVVLYQLMTGQLPFSAKEPGEWLHCHIARLPAPPPPRRDGLPNTFGAVVAKLLAKAPEDRYQTATGLLHDLRRCLSQLEGDAAKTDFPLGKHDRSPHLIVPEKLYGRERELEVLQGAFNDVATNGTTRLVLVHGEPGIGKSSLVNELNKTLLPFRGQFASGKFDQFKRDIPCAAVAQALGELLAPMLGRSDEALAAWRASLLEALGPNGALAVELLPELAFIIGDQPPVPELPTQQASARYQQLLRRLVGVFARHGHPLVLFFDDLQWLDGATLDLLEELARHPASCHLLLVGAYRDDELVDTTHPLSRRLLKMRDSGYVVHEIALAPLSEADTTRLLADALHCRIERAEPVARVICRKTAGNPFFVGHFIRELAARGTFAFDRGSGEWRWNLDAIQSESDTDNVVDLMIKSMGRLPEPAQRGLCELACLGSAASSSTLAMIHGATLDELHTDLWEAHRAELVIRAVDTYRFSHDRIQEAAYSLIKVGERAGEHLRIGRLLEKQVRNDAMGFDATFDVVGQLNRGATLITDSSERVHLAELNLLAGKRAKAAAALATATTYFIAGALLLDEDAWTRRHALAFELELHRAEGEFLAGEMGEAKRRLARLLERARDASERGAATCLLADVHFALHEPRRGVEVCIDCLRRAGLDLPTTPTDAQVDAAHEAIRARLGNRRIADLAELPQILDPALRATLEVLAKVVPSTATMGPNLMALVACTAVDFCLTHGNCDSACFAYVYYGGMVAARFEDFDASIQFAQLGVDLLERPGYRRFEAVVRTYFANQIVPWSRHVRFSCDLNRSTFDIAQAAGDRFSAAACAEELVAHLLVAGAPLDEVQREAEVGLDFSQNFGFGAFADVARSHAALVRNLRGLTTHFGSLDGDGFDEGRMAAHLAAQPDEHSFVKCFHSIHRLQARLFAGDHRGALEASRAATAVLWACPALIETAEHAFYTALSHTGACDTASPEERRGHAAAAGDQLKLLEQWARRCPDNWENRALLVAAEIAGIEGRDSQATSLYEEAVRSAHDSDFVQNEALALERAASFHASRGFDRIARAYLADALGAYCRWGADGKVRDLERRNPFLLIQPGPLNPERTVQTSLRDIDVATVLKVLERISFETDFGQLIEVVLRLGLEQAGARRGLLVLPGEHGFRIEAQANIDPRGIRVQVKSSEVTDGDMPVAILNYVTRTHDDVLISDDWREGPFRDDAYLHRESSRSALCMPLLKQARLVGVVYFENDLTADAFLAHRMPLLRLLASEAAISIENAQLAQALRERERETRLIVDTIPGLVATLSPDGVVSTINRQLVEFCGQSLSNMRHWFTNQTVHPHDAAHVTQVCSRAVELAESFAVDTRLRRFDGIYRWFQFRGTPLRDTDGEIVRWYVLLTDIDDLKQTESQLRQAERLQLEERLRERARIARTLHDTLLQGAQGFTLMVQAATYRMQEDDPARALLDNALERVQRVIEEGRDRIQDLRATERDGPELPARLALIGSELAGDTPARFRFSVDGTQRELHPNIADEAFLVAREALINAFAHAGLATVDLDILYSDAEFAIRIRDDGSGIDPKIIAQAGSPGHWGLRGMHERAERMRARFEIRRAVPHGTEVELHVAADVAYCW